MNPYGKLLLIPKDPALAELFLTRGRRFMQWHSRPPKMKNLKEGVPAEPPRSASGRRPRKPAHLHVRLLKAKKVQVTWQPQL